MIPPWLEIPLTLVVLSATFFLLLWGLNRDLLSPKVRRWGWLSVAVALASLAWSIGAESLAPYLRAGRWGTALRAALQALGALAGVVLMLAGALRFLRGWFGLDWALDQGATAFLRESPPFQEIQEAPQAAERRRRALHLILRTLRLPGLGWVGTGLGITLLALQLLEPDPHLAPDPRLVLLGASLLLLGIGQTWWAARATPAPPESQGQP